MTEYNPKEIEAKWQKEWEKSEIYKASEDSEKEKYYFLVEFPYQSVNLHVGHWYAFSVPDIAARFHRMNGKNVLYPIGFDAFGLPAENAAIKRGLNPRDWTMSNIEYMKNQLHSMGASFDWSKELSTCDPEYYKWTQWLFLKLFEKGLVYQGESLVNWCPKDKTVLANEQVIDGRCERCDSIVEEKRMLQWNIKITDYADRLVEDLEKLDWPQPIKDAQTNWIGKSNGMVFSSPVKDTDMVLETFSAHFEAFKADTFVVIAPDHPLLPRLVSGLPNEKEILEKAKQISINRDKNMGAGEPEGIFTGRYTIDPVGNGELPIWVASFALANYGTGIVKCSAHDERDFKFAKKYGINLKAVLFPEDPELRKQVENFEICYTDMKSGILIEPKEFNGKKGGEVREEIIKYLEKNNIAKRKTTYKLRDWVVSRQRYWGVPIPIIHCEKCGAVPVREEELPVVLPEIDDYLPRDDGKSPLSKAKKWVEVKCSKCGGSAERETDTLDTFVDSSWYFLRYTDPKNKEVFADKNKLKKWMPVDFYSGGAEHTTMHLLYSRFWHKALFDMGLVEQSEPYVKRMNRGLIMGPDGAKMSKSKGNVIDPDQEVERFGADTIRMYLAFIGPYNEVGAYPWNPDSVVGVRRFLERVWKLNEKVKDGAKSINLDQSIQKVTKEISSLKMNTGVSALMIAINELNSLEEISKENFETFLKLLAPFAPHMTEELWHNLGHENSIHTEEWPSFDESKLVQDEVTIVVQVNGKVRGKFVAKSDISEADAIEQAKQVPGIEKWIKEGEIKNAIYKPGKIVSLVV